ncbi:hypothetical protein IC229_33635 [Spirosoma sp. BT702]|uniref:Uncharacterized protein n=1 Tax=Spirosoma profusum TaxID=2771354 RepID=A0A927AWC7_9BACT|nr:hypothetical protein [Spirosoma profusum]MBD2705599.1 hypothetical protein [Spirosoma profusum]
MNTLNKPDLHAYFYDTYFLPTQQQNPADPIPKVLEKALDAIPFQARISERTLQRIRAKKER